MNSRLLNKAKIILNQPELIIAKLMGFSPIYYSHCLIAKDLSKLPIKTVIDIGANVGKFSETCKKVFPYAKIYSFEPIKECYKMINVKDGRIIPFNFALWDIDNKVDTFYLNTRDFETSSFLEYGKDNKTRNNSNIQEINVLKRRFDKLSLKIQRPCFVKIDVEGGEDRVIKGFGKRLREVDVLQIEWHFGDYYKGHEKLSKVIELLENNGLKGFVQKSVLNDKNKMPYKCDLFFFRTEK